MPHRDVNISSVDTSATRLSDFPAKGVSLSLHILKENFEVRSHSFLQLSKSSSLVTTTFIKEVIGCAAGSLDFQVFH